ncbi:MAG: NAD+ synthase [Candidatus Altiarchaeota archaeon]|nr:NAD+ synthase [Candidatus Altiarchaeota archaeon]
MEPLVLGSKRLAACRKRIASGIRGCVRKAHAKGVVVGMSGGVDSSVVAKIASESGVNVHAMMLPDDKACDPHGLEDAIFLAKELGIRHEVVPISPIVAAVEKSFPFLAHAKSNFRTARANIRPRARMLHLYLAANLDGRLVLGTTNKTELLLGYYTKHGDGACDLEPIGGLYKTQVCQLARHMGLPESLCGKTPTAGLWKGQTDEGEIGMSYREMDSILYSMVDCGRSPSETSKLSGISRRKVDSIAMRMAATAHKRAMPWVIRL